MTSVANNMVESYRTLPASLADRESAAGKEPQNKAAARDATGVSTVRSGRRFCSFTGRQKLVEGPPVSGMPFCGRRPQRRSMTPK
jgi:hypothetical protein